MLTGPGQPLVPYGMSYACATSKTLVSTLTGWFAAELKETPVKVSSVGPGFTATDMSGHQGTRHPSEGAEVVVRAAPMSADGPTGSFFDITGPVPW